MATNGKDFKIKNGLIVQGATATVNGNDVITSASSISDLSDIDTSGASDSQALVYNAATNSWIPGAAIGGGGGSYTISATAPESPSAGDVWFDSTDGKSYIYYDDGDTTQWLEIGSRQPGPTGATGSTGPQGDPGRFFTSDTAPENPVDGDVWFNSSNGVILVYYTDADSSQWVESGYPVLGYQTLDGLTDTDITSPSDGDALVYESSSGTWINSTPASTVSDLTDTTISTPADGQVLVYDSATSKWINSEVAGGATVSETAPENPSEGDLWLNATEAKMYVYYNDGVTSQWVAAVGGTVPQQGKVLQVVSVTKTDTFATTVSNTLQDVTGLSATITPSSANSKIFVIADIQGASSNNRNGYGVLVRDSALVAIGDASSSRPQASFDLSSPGTTSDINTSHWAPTRSVSLLDSPNTTSAVTYKIQVFASTYISTNVVYINRTGNDTNDVRGVRPASTITLMEIAE